MYIILVTVSEIEFPLIARDEITLKIGKKIMLL